jgi:GNAT superfamily N-acetyltransferase
MSGPSIREASALDAEDAVRVLRASIEELCELDHKRDPEILGAWLSNKTPQTFLHWLGLADEHVIVAELDAAIVGVGSVNRNGSVHLCYVAPGFQRRGVSAALLAALEERALAWGLSELVLTSSETALGFYLRQGYVPTGPRELTRFGMAAYPFRKALIATPAEP